MSMTPFTKIAVKFEKGKNEYLENIMNMNALSSSFVIEKNSMRPFPQGSTRPAQLSAK